MCGENAAKMRTLSLGTRKADSVLNGSPFSYISYVLPNSQGQAFRRGTICFGPVRTTHDEVNQVTRDTRDVRTSLY